MRDLYVPSSTKMRQSGPDIRAIAAVVAIGGVVWYLSRNTSGGGGDPNLGGGMAQGLSVSFAQPAPKFPGDLLRATLNGFNYQGPPDTLIFWIALRPDTGLFGADFDDGDNVVNSPFNFFATGGFSIGNFPVSTSITVNLIFQIRVPDPNDVFTTRSGATVDFNFGVADAWFGLSSANLRALHGLPNGDPGYFHPLSQIAGVTTQEAVDIQQTAPVGSNLNVSFSNRGRRF